MTIIDALHENILYLFSLIHHHSPVYRPFSYTKSSDLGVRCDAIVVGGELAASLIRRAHTTIVSY
jgi:hypothetical protein